MHYDSAYTKISANSGVDQGCPLSTCGISAAIDLVLRICRLHDPGAKLFAYLDDWCLWIKPQHLTAATRSVNLELQPSKNQVRRASCQDPIPPELQDKVKLTLSCLGRHLQIHGDIEPSPVVLGEQASTEKTTQSFQRIATTLADLNAEGLNAQTVNDLLSMYVGAASQHVLPMSFVPEQTCSRLCLCLSVCFCLCLCLTSTASRCSSGTQASAQEHHPDHCGDMWTVSCAHPTRSQ